jgi:dimethylsulfone monooxygenase
MKLALYLPNFRDKVTVEELEDLTRLAEELEFDSVWTLDRIVVPEASDRQELQYPFGMMTDFPPALPVSSRGEWFQGFPLLSWLAAKTTKLRIGMSIIDTPYRAPGVLAAELATVDHLTGGRLNAGSAPAGCLRSSRPRARRTSFPGGTRTCARARDARDHAGHLDERPLRVPR